MKRFWFVALLMDQGIYGEETPRHILFTTKGEKVDDQYKLYYGTALQWTVSNSQMSIVHSYGIVSDDDYDRQDEIYAEYENTYGKPTPVDFDRLKVADISGWIAPNGDFYYTGFMGHSQVAKELVRFFKIATDPEVFFSVRDSEALRKNGWISVWAGSFSSEGSPSPEQFDTIVKIFNLSNGVFKRHAEGIIEYLRLHRVKHALVLK